MKICSKCKVPKTIDNFANNKQSIDGHFHWCKECKSKYMGKYYKINHKKMYDDSRKWILNNKERLNKWRREYDHNLLLNPSYRLSVNIGNSIYQSLRSKKGGRKWEKLVGYTLDDLIKRLSSKLTGEMTWENYGPVWHIDHVRPKSWFKYVDDNDLQFKECWALFNLQPKLKFDNISKSNRFVG